jgi:hypothetical protein
VKAPISARRHPVVDVGNIVNASTQTGIAASRRSPIAVISPRRKTSFRHQHKTPPAAKGHCDVD